MFDYVVIGAGIVGLATARRLLERSPNCSVAIVEKENTVATHQTGKNSGVIHAGVYYAPGSMKAKFCRAGVQATIDYARAHNVLVEQCGKMLVATSAVEVERMAQLHERCQSNNLPVEKLSASVLTEREPNIVGKGALFVPATGIVDYVALSHAMAAEILEKSCEIYFGSAVRRISERSTEVVVETSDRTLHAKYLVVCGGLQADRLARMAGIEVDFAIIPFRGEYYRLAPEHDKIINHLIYPIPDPDLPFLGVHLTKMVEGYVTVGPNAVLGLAREGYMKSAINLRDLIDMAKFPGFWRVLQDNWSSGTVEMLNSLSKKRYLKLCRRYAPSLKVNDLRPHPTGIRAQAVMHNGTLLHDFLIKRSSRTIHVCNAPSPAATSAIPIAEYLVKGVPEV